MRNPVALVLAAATLALPARAGAADWVGPAAAALANDPVYVAPAARATLPVAQAGRLRREIETRADGPVYVAVLPAAALAQGGGDATGLIDAIHSRLGRRGVYAVVAGRQFRAESTDLGAGEAGRLATAAFDAHHSEGVAPTLVDFVDRVGADRSGGSRGGGSSGGSGISGGIVLLLAVAAAAAFLLVRRSRRRRADAAELAAVKEAARDDLVALAGDVQELETRVEAHPEAKRDYLAAVEQYGRASERFDRARTAAELEPVAQALEEGRYLMASAEARLAGRRPPERRPPCFFDPRHGPSVRDVLWAPPGGQPRAVPACAADALRVEEGVEPESRHVLVGGAAMPYWAAGPLYGGYFGGFFPGLVLGELMGGFGPWGAGWGMGAWGDGWDAGPDWDAGGGGSDFGGGDFGGGDSGGGDF